MDSFNKGGLLDRREFIKLSMMALGGIALTGCGGSSSSPTPTNFPNGYKFFRLKNSRTSIASSGNSLHIDKFYGSTHISSEGIVTFDARDSNGRRGIFQLGVDFNGCRPKIEWERCSVMTGNKLVDDRKVYTIKKYDVDEHSNIAAIIDADVRHSEHHYGSGLYIDMGQKGFEPILTTGQAMGNSGAMSSGIFGDVSINNTHILTTAHHLPAADSRSIHKDSLIHIPDATTSASNFLVSAGDIIMGTEHKIDSFGLLDHNADGNYSAGIFTKHTDPEFLQGSPSKSVFNIRGHIEYPLDTQLLTASSGVQSSDAYIPGEGGYGPRVGPDGVVYTLLDNDEQMLLTRDNEIILSSGKSTDKGDLLGFSTGSVGADGNYYYTAISEKDDQFSMTLYVFDGVQHTALISTGDILSDWGAPVEQILFGTTTKHVDMESRLAFFCSFADGTTSLVVGMPC